MYGRIDGGMKRRMDRWKDEGLKDEWISGWRDGCMDGRMEGSMEGWTEGLRE